jgi:hypothetical protein
MNAVFCMLVALAFLNTKWQNLSGKIQMVGLFSMAITVALVTFILGYMYFTSA